MTFSSSDDGTYGRVGRGKEGISDPSNAGDMAALEWLLAQEGPRYVATTASDFMSSDITGVSVH
jgi:hypothetical protein